MYFVVVNLLKMFMCHNSTEKLIVLVRFIKKMYNSLKKLKIK